MRAVRIGSTARFKSIRARGLPVVASVALVALAMSAGVASADVGRDYRNAENTFTKWISVPGPAPIVASMAGIVGGDVGAGTFTGEVLTLVDNPSRMERG